MAYYEDVLFGGTDLTLLPNLKVTDVVIDRLPKVVLSKGKLSRKDGVKIYNKQYGEKKVTVEGYIGNSTRDGYLQDRTELLSYLNGVEGTLSVIIGQTPYEFTATVGNVMFKDSAGGYGAFSIDFVCSEPFARDRDAITLIDNTASTTSPTDFSFSELIGGSYKAPLDVRLNLVAVTGSTDSYIQLSNQATEAIKIIRTWSAGDTLEIDFHAKTCTVNGTAVDYLGNFWQVDITNSEITYTDDFTSRSITLLATYKRRYL